MLLIAVILHGNVQVARSEFHSVVSEPNKIHKSDGPFWKLHILTARTQDVGWPKACGLTDYMRAPSTVDARSGKWLLVMPAAP